jgi:hypothetical protein
MSELRDEIEKSFDATETETPEAGRSQADTTESVRDTSEARTADTGESSAAEETSGTLAAAKAKAEGAPDDAVAGAPKTEPVADKSLKQFEKAPASWKPGARERWMTLPADVRAEVHRRESEATQVLQETAQARQVMGGLQQMSQKYAPMLQAEGVDILQATERLADIATRLRFSPQAEKARMMAYLVGEFGVDIAMLDNALAGVPQPQSSQQTFTDPRLDALLQQRDQWQQERQQKLQTEASKDIAAFGQDPAHEFFSDVRDIMADLLDVADKRGVDLDLKGAYDRAIRIHPDIAKVIEQRAAAQRAQNPAGSTAKAKAAASSIKGSPIPGGPAKTGSTVRESILEAMDQVSGR